MNTQQRLSRYFLVVGHWSAWALAVLACISTFLPPDLKVQGWSACLGVFMVVFLSQLGEALTGEAIE